MPSSGGISSHNAISTFFGSLIPSTSPMRFVSRIQCVSVTIAGLPNTSPMMRFALFLPTPGSFNSVLNSSGTLQSNSSRSIFIQALMSLALLRPSPHGLTMRSISSTSAFAMASIVGYSAYKSCTITLTLASHCAARRTLTSSFHASL